MTRKYDEVMDRIEITEGMRRRILQNIRQTPQKKAPEKPKKSGIYRVLLPLAACLVLLVGVLSVPALRKESREEESPVPSIQAVNGIMEAESPEKLSEMVGFKVLGLSELPFEVRSVTCASCWGNMAQIEYTGDNISCTYRQSRGTEDNSGDYTAYEITEKRTMGGAEVTLKGHAADEYLAAVWTDGTFSFSVLFTEPVSAAAFEQTVSAAGR